MTGKRNGVASKLREESKLLLSMHCICHRLVLECNDVNDDVAYIKTVEKILIQLWSLFHNSAKKTAAYAKAVVNYNQISLSSQVLPPLAHLSKVFQAGSVSFSAIGPAINYTLETLRLCQNRKSH